MKSNGKRPKAIVGGGRLVVITEKCAMVASRFYGQTTSHGWQHPREFDCLLCRFSYAVERKKYSIRLYRTLAELDADLNCCVYAYYSLILVHRNNLICSNPCPYIHIHSSIVLAGHLVRHINRFSILNYVILLHT